jgi:hypothetical protein
VGIGAGYIDGGMNPYSPTHKPAISPETVITPEIVITALKQ